MLNKKGVEMPLATLAIFVVVGIVVLVVLGIFKPTASEAGTFSSYYTLKSKIDKCKLDTSTSDTTLNKANDRDGDGLLDDCDPCVCSRVECKNIIKKNSYDGDGDLVPKGCDVDDSNPKKTGCKLPLSTEDGRCLEGAVS